jgi:hypothetical protein
MKKGFDVVLAYSSPEQSDCPVRSSAESKCFYDRILSYHRKVHLILGLLRKIQAEFDKMKSVLE